MFPNTCYSIVYSNTREPGMYTHGRIYTNPSFGNVRLDYHIGTICP